MITVSSNKATDMIRKIARLPLLDKYVLVFNNSLINSRKIY